MKYILWAIPLVVGFVGGLLVRKKKQGDPDTAPVSVVDLLRLYEQIRRDVLDDVARDITIKKLKERLGL